MDIKVRKLLVDVHTHCYLPRYAALLRQRTLPPRIVSQNQEGHQLFMYNGQKSASPIGPQYWDRNEKLKFMNLHDIDVSIVSTANPWLDFLDKPSTASQLANELNEDLENYCATSPGVDGFDTMKRLYGFGLLPLIEGIGTEDLLQTVKHITGLPHLKGIIMGTRGVGKGLDDPALEPLWEALSNTKLVVFLHPHYGLGSGAKEAWGDQENGNVLSLGIGFPVETTTAITRLILTGAFDRYPNLRILLAHSGGALPQLSSRIASCISHDPLVSSRLKHDMRYYVSKFYYDAVNYGPEEMGFVADVIGRGTAYSSTPGMRGDRLTGYKRILLGTGKEAKSAKVLETLQAINDVQRWEEEHKDAVRGGNAIELFGLGQ